jgi:hypothetical protein
MKTKIIGFFAALALIFTLTFPAGAPAAPPAANGAVTTAQPAPPPHPEIHAAINSLEHARVHLKEARHDFGGHREEALRATDEAIRQLKICLEFDK